MNCHHRVWMLANVLIHTRVANVPSNNRRADVGRNTLFGMFSAAFSVSRKPGKKREHPTYRTEE